MPNLDLIAQAWAAAQKGQHIPIDFEQLKQVDERTLLKLAQLGHPAARAEFGRRGLVAPGSLQEKVVKSSLGRTIGGIAAGGFRGISFGLLQPEMAHVPGEAAPKFTRTGRVLGVPAEIIGVVTSPVGRVLRPVGAASTRAFSAARTAATLGRVRGPIVRPIFDTMVRAAGEGAAFSVVETLANDFDTVQELADKRGPNAAALYMAQRAGVKGAEWAAFSAVLHGLAGMIQKRLLRRADAQRMREAAAPTKPTAEQPVQTALRLPPERVNMQAFRAGADELDTAAAIQTLYGGGPVPAPRVPTAVEQELEAMANASLKQIRAGSRALGLNPRRIAQIAKERGISLEEAKQQAVREAAESPLERGTEAHQRLMRERGVTPPESPERLDITVAKLLKEERGAVGPRTVRFYHGTGGAEGAGLTGDWWTTSPKRAASFGPNVRYVDVPADEARSFMLVAQEAGSGTTGDAILPSHYISQARPASVRPDIYRIAGKTLASEAGAIRLDLLTGRIGRGPLADVLGPGATVRDLETIAAAKMAGGARTRAALERAMAAEIGEPWAGVDPQLRERIFLGGERIWKKKILEKIGGTSSVRRFLELWKNGESGAEWYSKMKAELRQILPDEDSDLLISLLALTSQGSAVSSNLELAVKAFSQIKLGKKPSGLFLGQKNVEALLRGESPGGPKVQNFRSALRDNTTEDWAKILDGVRRGEVVYSAPENSVVIDRRIAAAAGFPLRKGTAGYSAQLNDAEYAFLSELIRDFARKLTQQRWQELAARGATPETLARARVTPRDLQAMIWVGWGEKDAARFLRMGRRAPTSASFSELLQARPDLRRRLRLAGAKNDVAPPEWSNPQVLPKTLASEEYVIVGTDPAAGRKVAGLRVGEDVEMAMLRELAERGYGPESVIYAKGRWIDPTTKEVFNEPTFIVRGLSARDGRALASRYGQSAYITRHGLIDTDTGQVKKFTGRVAFEANPDGHTVINTPTGPLTFRMEFADNLSGALPEVLAPAELRQLARPRDALGLLREETGAVFPGGRPKLSMRYDPATGKFVMSDGSPVPPEFARDAARLEQEFARTSFQQTLRTGTPVTEATAELEFGAPVRGAQQLSMFPERRGALKIAKSWLNYGVEASVAVKLTAPLTHLRNIFGNTAAMFFSPAQKLTAAGIDVLRSAATGAPRERFAGEALYEVVGRYNALKMVVPNLVRALRNPSMRGKFAEGGEQIPGRAGEIVRLPFRALAAMDDVFKEINRQGTIMGLAWRQAMKEGADDVAAKAAEYAIRPTTEMAEITERAVKEYVFHEELGTFGSLLLRATNEVPVLKLVIPFIRTPLNVAKFFARRTPFGALTAKPQIGAALTGQTAAPLSTYEMEERLARSVVGSLVLATTTMFALEGKITGAGPADPKKRELLYAQGWQPYSIRVGDTYVSYRGMEPAASFLAFPASIVESYRSEDDLKEASAMALKQMGRLIGDAAFVDQIGDMFDAILDPARSAGKFASNVVSGLVPRAVAAAARTIDPTLRTNRSVEDKLFSEIPGLTGRARPQLDAFGRPIVREQLPSVLRPLTEFVPRFSVAKDDPLAAELERLGVGIPHPARTLTRRGEKIERTEEELDRIKSERGRRIRDRLTKLIMSPSYQSLSDDQKKRVLERWMRAISEEVQ